MAGRSGLGMLMWCGLLAAGLGCATVQRAPPPPPPTDAQLANNGSAAEQAALLERYRVAWASPDQWAIGNAKVPAAGGPWAMFFLFGRTPFPAPELRAYVSGSPAAQAAFASPAWQAINAVSYFTGVALLGLGSVAGAAFIAASAVQHFALEERPLVPMARGTPFMLANSNETFLWGSVAMGGAVLAVMPLWVAVVGSGWWITAQETAAVNQYNQELEARIHAAATPSAPTAVRANW